MNKGHLQHAGEVLGRFFEPREDAAALLEPADESFHDVSLSVCLAVEVNRTGVAVFIALGGDHRLNAPVEQVLVNPIGPISFVAGQLDGKHQGTTIVVHNLRSFQQLDQPLRLMRLAGRQVKVQRMAVAIAEQMNFGRKAPAGAA